MNLQILCRTCKLPWRSDRCCEHSDWSRRQKGYEGAVQKHGESVVKLILGSILKEVRVREAVDDLMLIWEQRHPYAKDGALLYTP